LVALTAERVSFVSRLKDSTSYIIVEERSVADGSNILRDEVIILASDKADPGKAMRLGRIEVWLEEKQDTLVFVTNHLKLAAKTIGPLADRIILQSDLSSRCESRPSLGPARTPCRHRSGRC
jgi:hypothetical protein